MAFVHYLAILKMVKVYKRRGNMILAWHFEGRQTEVSFPTVAHCTLKNNNWNFSTDNDSIGRNKKLILTSVAGRINFNLNCNPCIQTQPFLNIVRVDNIKFHKRSTESKTWSTKILLQNLLYARLDEYANVNKLTIFFSFCSTLLLALQAFGTHSV